MLWKERFSLGIEVIDEQHRHLVELVGKTKMLLQESEEGHDCYDEIIDVLRELANYTIVHFTFEEEHMERLGVEDLIAHKMEHKIFVKKVSHFMSNDLEGNQSERLEEMTIFLLEWLVKHILETDVKYVPLMKNIS